MRNTRLGLATVLLLLPTHAPAQDLERITTPAGRDMMYFAMPDAEYSQLTLFWSGPTSLSIPGKEGLTSLGAQLPFEEAGGRRFEDVTEELQDEDTLLGLSASFVGATLTLQTLQTEPDGMDAGVAIARDILTEPTLAEDDLDWLKTNIQSGLAEEARDPFILAERTLGQAIAGHDRRLSALTNRPFDVVATVTSEDVRDWMDRTFHNGPLIVAAGPLGADVAGAAADSILDELPATDAAGDDTGSLDPLDFRAQARPVVLQTPEADSAIVLMGLPIPTFSLASGAILSALAGGDGSRLFTRLRQELGATYDISRRTQPLHPDVQVAIFAMLVPPERVAETVAVLREEVEVLARDGVTDAELSLARNEIDLALSQFATDPQAQIAIATDREFLGVVPTITALQDELTGTSAADVNAQIARTLSVPPAIIVATPVPLDLDGACQVETPVDAATCFD